MASIAAVRNFDNQQGKDVKTKQYYCPLKQDHPMALHLATRIQDRNDRDCFVIIHAHILDIIYWALPF
jgi:hypothetical protein